MGTTGVVSKDVGTPVPSYIIPNGTFWQMTTPIVIMMTNLVILFLNRTRHAAM